MFLEVVSVGLKFWGWKHGLNLMKTKFVLEMVFGLNH